MKPATKIAPTLKLYFIDRKHPAEILNYEATALRREAAALIACARELYAIKRVRGHENDCCCSMCRRLSALDRASGAPRRKP